MEPQRAQRIRKTDGRGLTPSHKGAQAFGSWRTRFVTNAHGQLLGVLVDTDEQNDVVLLVHEIASPWRRSQGIRRTRPSSRGGHFLSWHHRRSPTTSTPAAAADRGESRFRSMSQIRAIENENSDFIRGLRLPSGRPVAVRQSQPHVFAAAQGSAISCTGVPHLRNTSRSCG